MQRLKQYLNLIRFDRPVGTWLLFLPCMFSLLFARSSFPSVYEISIFLVGAFFMRSSGCIINDLWDRKLDSKVSRTRSRPLASEAITVFEALFILLLFLSCSAFLLFLFNPATIKLGFMALLFILTYPLMKRVTWYPQIFLGLTFNFGILMAWSSVHGGLSLLPILLYIAGICWTVGYDTIYAHQDIVDDLSIGIKSTAIKFGSASKEIVLVLYLIFLLVMLYVGLSIGLGLLYLILFNVVAFVILSNVQLCNLSLGEDCAAEFKRNSYYGFLLLVVISITKLLS